MTPQSFISIVNQLLPEPHASLLGGMLFGKLSRLPPEFYSQLQVTGTLHMIALSGTNVVIITRVFGTLFLPFGRRLGSLFNILWIILFVMFVGPSPSIIRAAFMGSISLIAVYLGRPYYALLSLAMATLVVAFFVPEWLFEISFQLSFLASLGIICSERIKFKRYIVAFKERFIAPNNQRTQMKKNSFSSWTFGFASELFGENLKATLAAQLFTFPVIFFTFKKLSLISPLTNLLVGWIVPPVTVLGMVMVFLSLVFYPLGQIVSWFVWAMLEYFIGIIDLTSRIPFAQISF